MPKTNYDDYVEAFGNEEPEPKEPKKVVEKKTESPLMAKKERKTISMPYIYDLALRELKERKNISRQFSGEKGKVTDDDIMQIVMERFFGLDEFADCLKAAENKLKNIL